MKKILKFGILLATLVLISSCGKNNNVETKEEPKKVEMEEKQGALSLDELTVTYVTSPLNIPSIV